MGHTPEVEHEFCKLYNRTPSTAYIGVQDDRDKQPVQIVGYSNENRTSLRLVRSPMCCRRTVARALDKDTVNSSRQARNVEDLV